MTNQLSLIIAGKEIALTEAGYLVNLTDWTTAVAEQLAVQEEIILSDANFAIKFISL